MQANPFDQFDAPQSRGGQVITLNDPEAEFRQQQAIEAAARQRAKDARDADIAPLQKALLAAQVAQQQAAARKAQQGSAGAQGGDQKVANLRALQAQLDRVRELYKSGPGATHGLNGLWDYLPTDANSQFDTAGAGLGDIAAAAFRIPGSGAQSDADVARLVAANQPSASDRDVTIEEKLNTLQQRLDQTYQQLGITPETAAPQQSDRRDAVGYVRPDTGGNVLQTLVDNGPGGGGGMALTTGDTTTQRDPQASAMVDRMIRMGATPAQINAALMSGGFKPAPVADIAAALQHHKDYPGYKGSYGDVTRIVPVENQNLNRFVQSPMGTFATQAANAGSMGVAQMLAGREGFDALAEKNPIASGLGQVAGTIGATNAIGKIGANTLGKIAPKLLGGGAKAQFGRNLATDIAYGAGYGGITEGDPVSGAVGAGLGSAAGQGIGRALGSGLTGVTSSPTISRLRANGVIPTIGEIARGRAADNGGRSIVAGLEDTIANTPGASALVNSARTRSLGQGNTAAFRIAGEGAPITGTGEAALDQLGVVKNRAYSDALDGVRVPVDPTMEKQVQAAIDFGQNVDTARSRGDFDLARRQGFDSIINGAPELSGKQVQDALRYTADQSRMWNRAANGASPDPSASGLADAFGQLNDAVTGATARAAPDAIPALKKANRINRNLNILDDASGAAMNNGGVWTAAQLGQAIKANSSKFGGGRGLSKVKNSPLYQHQQDMQAVLANQVPPTGVNLAPLIAMGGLGATGAGQATDSDTLKYLGGLGLLAVPYTKVGQGAIAKALLDRPDKLKQLGAGVRKYKGLIGSGAAGLALSHQ